VARSGRRKRNLSKSPRSPKSASPFRPAKAGQKPRQLELPFSSPPSEQAKAAPPRSPGLRVIQGGGKRRHEPLTSRDAVIRVLVEAGADMLLRRISVERAEEIQDNVDRVLELFDRIDRAPNLIPVLQRELEELETLMTETRSARRRRQGSP
jgi:hypothetical protein